MYQAYEALVRTERAQDWKSIAWWVGEALLCLWGARAFPCRADACVTPNPCIAFSTMQVAVVELPFGFVPDESTGGAGGTCVIRGCVPKKLLVYA